jgi:hypothetical protein
VPTPLAFRQRLEAIVKTIPKLLEREDAQTKRHHLAARQATGVPDRVVVAIRCPQR